MEYVNLGRSALRVSRIGLGCMGFGSSAWRPWVLDEGEALPLLRRGVELGINFLDTANVYSTGRSEEIIGRFVRSQGRRDAFVVATKLFYPVGEGPAGLGRANVTAACEASLRRLGLDYIDLLQIHRWDPQTPIEETLSALDRLVRAGKVRALGASNLRGWQLAKANLTARLDGGAGFVSVQAHYNLLHREDEHELIPCCLDAGVSVLPWSPLARGRLARAAGRTGCAATGSARSGTDDVADTLYGTAHDPILDVVADVARQAGTTAAEVAIAWLCGRPGVAAPIVGVTRAGQLETAVAAASRTLDPAWRVRLEAAYTPRAYRELPWTARNQQVLADPDPGE